MNDLYTKMILTVIALCLIVIAFRSTPYATATSGQPVDIVAVGGRTVYSALPVEAE